MKRILLLLLLATLAVPSFAAKKKASAKKETPAAEAVAVPRSASAANYQSEAPALTDNAVQFKAFSGSFIKYGNMSAGSRPFTLKIEYSPWFFEYTGKVNAAHNTADLDIYENEVVAVVAYHDAPGKTAEGIAYQAGLFDVMIYLEDEPTRISETSVKLVGVAAQENAAAPVLAQAKTFAGLVPGQVFSDPANEKALTAAQADALDKSAMQAAQKAEQKRKADSLTAEKLRVADSIKAEKLRIADSVKAEKLRVADSVKAEKLRVADSVKAYKREQKRLDDDAAAAAAASKKKKKKKKAVVEEDASADESVAADESDEPVVVKKKKKKKKAMVEEDASADESVAADESDEPVVVKKKKKKKKAVVEEDASADESVAADESDEPVVVKKKKKKKKVVEEAAEEATEE
jgi:hypothetical protein